MKNLKPKILMLIFTTLFFSCNNNETILEPVTEDQLPPITETGANTFGCLINGKVFIPKDKTGYTPPGGGTPKGLEVTIGSFLPSYEYFSIDAENYQGIYIYIYPKKYLMK